MEIDNLKEKRNQPLRPTGGLPTAGTRPGRRPGGAAATGVVGCEGDGCGTTTGAGADVGPGAWDWECSCDDCRISCARPRLRPPPDPFSSLTSARPRIRSDSATFSSLSRQSWDTDTSPLQNSTRKNERKKD